MSNLAALQRALGHSFADPALLTRALSHRSLDQGQANNERLEFLGDALISMLVAWGLTERFADADEGTLSRMRTLLVSRKAQAGQARRIGLGDHLLLGPSAEGSGGRASDALLSGALEALVAAVFLDAGLQQCRAVLARLLAADLAAITEQGGSAMADAKTRLQQHLQASGQALPHYQPLGDHPPHRVQCRAAGLAQPTTGEGPSRQCAEQAAAARALEQLLGR